MEELIVSPVYLWAFQTNREQLKLFFPFRSEKQPIIPHSIYDVFINKKQQCDLIMKSHLAVILAKKLVGNIRYPRSHSQMILSRQHYFQKVKCVETLAEHSDVVNCVAFHPTAPLLATGSDDKTVKLWRLSPDASTATCVSTLNGHKGIIYSVAFHPKFLILASGSWDHTLFFTRWNNCDLCGNSERA